VTCHLWDTLYIHLLLPPDDLLIFEIFILIPQKQFMVQVIDTFELVDSATVQNIFMLSKSAVSKLSNLVFVQFLIVFKIFVF